MTRKIILTAIGSSGDVYPLVAVGQQLREIGLAPVLAVSSAHVKQVERAGLEAAAILPPLDELARQQGLSNTEAVKGSLTGLHFLTEHILLPALEECTARLEEAARGAAAIAGTFLAYPAPIVAEKLDIPYIPLALQPMSLFSTLDPPQCPMCRLMVSRPKTVIGKTWNRLHMAALRQDARWRYAPRINRVRTSHGLRPQKSAPLFGVEKPPPLRLGLYSPLLASTPDKHWKNLKVVGFPGFDAKTTWPMEPGLEAFLSNGPPPLIFTLGTFVIHAPGDFYKNSLKAARSLGMRAVLLTGHDYGFENTETLFTCRFAPHASVFPKTAAVIHHGGIGTTGQALAAGRPQLIVPHMLDQWDNGERIQRLGVGDVLVPEHYTPEAAAARINRLMTDETVQEHASRSSRAVRAENGALHAAEAIAACV